MEVKNYEYQYINKDMFKKINSALKSYEKKIVDIETIRTKLHANVQKLNNVRNIKNIIEELIGIELVNNILAKK